MVESPNTCAETSVVCEEGVCETADGAVKHDDDEDNGYDVVILVGLVFCVGPAVRRYF